MPYTEKQKRLFYADMNARKHGRKPLTSMTTAQLKEGVNAPTKAAKTKHR